MTKHHKEDIEPTMEETILIAGGRGYIGSNTLNKIFFLYKKCNFVVIGLTEESAKSTIDPDILASPRYKYIQMNIGDEEGIMGILNENNVSIVLHLASYLPNIPVSNTEFLQNNIINSEIFLKTCFNYGKIKHFMFQVSELGYNGSNTNKLEDNNKFKHTYSPSLYESTKITQTHLATLYKYNLKMPITIISPIHIFGGTNPHEDLTPNLYVNVLCSKNKINLFKNDDKNYDSWLNIKDLIRAFVVIINKGFTGTNYNPSNHKLFYTNYQIAQIVIKSIKENKNYLEYINLDKEIVTDVPNLKHNLPSTGFGHHEWKPKYSNFIEYVKSLKCIIPE